MNSRSWDEIADKVRIINFTEKFDLLIAIANGGIIPAALINQRLQLPIELLKLSFRDETQKPIYGAPKLMEEIRFDFKSKVILLVEDRVKTGATLNFAKQILTTAALIKTFAVNGKADYSLFDESCFRFPWNL